MTETASRIKREQREAIVGHRSKVIWLYGLSGSGKTTLATGLQQRLHAQRFLTYILDGDSFRRGLSNDLGFSDDDRRENIRRAAEVAQYLFDASVIAICAFITPRNEHRVVARNIIGRTNLIEVFVSASFEACARRDPKGLYARAASGTVREFTGHDSKFDVPKPNEAAIVVDTEGQNIAESIESLYRQLWPMICRV